jgi:hypothetical protein
MNTMSTKSTDRRSVGISKEARANLILSLAIAGVLIMLGIVCWSIEAKQAVPTREVTGGK